MLRKGHQSTFQHGWQYGSLFVCSFTCYLLNLSILSAQSHTSPAHLYNKHPFLKIIFWLCLLTPFCVCMTRAMKQRFFLGEYFCIYWVEDCSEKNPNHTDFTRIRNKHTKNSCQQAFLSHAPRTLPSNTHSNLLPLSSNISTTSFFLVSVQELQH